VLSPCQRYGAWVDILAHQLFHYDFERKALQTFSVGTYPSTIFSVDRNSIEYLHRDGISVLTCADGCVEPKWVWPEINATGRHRGNDGAFIRGRYVFGTMELEPQAGTGRVFSARDGELADHGPIGIPNSFLLHPDGVLISDSAEQKTYLYDANLSHRRLWADFSDAPGTPDGGCLSESGTYFICLWGAGSVLELDDAGQVLRHLPVPAKNPTKCAVRAESLLVTSALEDTTDQDLASYPLSGHTFLVTI
jgi:sugar lactone lactonase YvrE